jgi:creatinine amidohydrolase
MNHDIGSMTMVEFSEAMARNSWLLLPIGTTEEHGPHLPLSSDMIQAEYVCRAVAREVNGVVAPGVAYGVCRTTRNFPGTISLSSGTLEALVREILGGYIEKGARRIAVISGHAGGAHMEALRQAALPLVDRDERLAILVIGPFDIALPFLAEAGFTTEDGHAASIETSVLLAVDPHLVRTNLIPEAGRPQFPRFQVMSHPERLFPSGVMGDASRASPALGERALHHVVGEIVKLLKGMLSGGES